MIAFIVCLCLFFNLSFIIITSSLWSIYFSLELQWMLLSVFFIIGSSVYRGLLNYLIINCIISILLINGTVFCNSLFFILGLYGKIGYLPFIIIILFIYNSSSFVFLIIDLINKWTYINILITLFNISIFFIIVDYSLILLNYIVIIFLIKFIISIKHLFIISSFFTVIFLMLLIVLKNELFSINYLMLYTAFNLILLYTMIVHTCIVLYLDVVCKLNILVF